MGTRGVFGVRYDQRDKMMYNHFDSYPSGLGDGIFRQIREAIETEQKIGDGDFPAALDRCIALWRDEAAAARIVGNDDKPMAEDKAKCRAAGLVDLGVSGQSEDDWYCLTRKGQGEMLKMLAVGLFNDAGTFILDSLFCEWGYLLNLDTGELEIYRGFQKRSHTEGRYAQRTEYLDEQRRENKGRPKRDQFPAYYPCALIATLPLADLPRHESLSAFLVTVGAIEADAA